MLGTVPNSEKELPGWRKQCCVQRPWGGEEDEGGAVKSMMRERARVELGPSHMDNGALGGV